MSASDVASALQTINATITGITTAPTEMPGHLDTAQLPCALAYPGPAEHSDASYTHLRSDRTWLIRVYVKPLGQGRGVDEGYQECLPFLHYFATEYITQEHTSNTAWECLHYTGDNGVRADMTLHNADTGEYYWGVEFTVLVTQFTESSA